MLHSVRHSPNLTNKYLAKLECFTLEKFFHPSLIFVSDVGSTSSSYQFGKSRTLIRNDQTKLECLILGNSSTLALRVRLGAAYTPRSSTISQSYSQTLDKNRNACKS